MAKRQIKAEAQPEVPQDKSLAGVFGDQVHPTEEGFRMIEEALEAMRQKRTKRERRRLRS
jgi:phospholipase/lecithinase/hemolysin